MLMLMHIVEVFNLIFLNVIAIIEVVKLIFLSYEGCKLMESQ